MVNKALFTEPANHIAVFQETTNGFSAAWCMQFVAEIKPYSCLRYHNMVFAGPRQYSHCKVQGLDCRQARKISLIAARADQVDIAKLFREA